MAQRKVVWTKTADIQLVGILEYRVNRNKSNTYSKKLISLVSQKTKLIAENPHIYKLTDFKDIRVASIENFSLYYSIAENQIVIYAFWDNRQDPIKLLKILESTG